MCIQRKKEEEEEEEEFVDTLFFTSFCSAVCDATSFVRLFLIGIRSTNSDPRTAIYKRKSNDAETLNNMQIVDYLQINKYATQEEKVK